MRENILWSVYGCFVYDKMERMETIIAIEYYIIHFFGMRSARRINLPRSQIEIYAIYYNN